MTLFKGLALAAAVSLGSIAASPAFAANLITNGSFETGGLNDWTLGGAPYAIYGTNVYVISGSSYGYSAESGSDFALLGPVGGDGYLSQSFADVAGRTYTLSYWVASDGGEPNDFGSTIYSTADGSTVEQPSGYLASTDGAYDHYVYTFVGTGDDTLTFNFRDDPGYLALDNVSVTGVPEPAAWAFLLLGVGAIGAALRGRRQTRGSLAAI